MERLLISFDDSAASCFSNELQSNASRDGFNLKFHLKLNYIPPYMIYKIFYIPIYASIFNKY